MSLARPPPAAAKAGAGCRSATPRSMHPPAHSPAHSPPPFSPTVAANRVGRMRRLGQAAVCSLVGISAKLFATFMLRSRANAGGLATLRDAVLKRAHGRPLVTYSNHNSTIDDPALWGALLPSSLFNRNVRHLRWSLGAQEICYANKLKSLFFSLGRVIPIVRGHGIYQPGMQCALDLLAQGEWVHIFPEGKVHQDDRTVIDFKWGIGRLIMESPVPPLLIPIYHFGMGTILPLKDDDALLGGWVPRFLKPFNIRIGEVIDTSSWRAQLASLTSCDGHGSSLALQRQLITEHLRNLLAQLAKVEFLDQEEQSKQQKH